MKKSLLAVAFAVAAASLTFAAPQTSTAPASSDAPKTATPATKKHVKKSHKAKKQAAVSNSTAAKPATK